MGKQILNQVGSWFASLALPKTPRGRVRQAFFLVLLLMVFAGNLAQPKYWNAAADKFNVVSPVKVPHYWDLPFSLGLDLQGGTHLIYTADMKDVPEEDRADAMSGVRDVIERRVNAFGVSEPLVQVNRSGEVWRLVVDLAGVTDISDAIQKIGETPILEFKEENTIPPRELTAEEQSQIDSYNKEAMGRAKEALSAAKAADADFAAIAAAKTEDAISKERGGDLGFVTAYSPYYQLVDKISEGKLEVGQVFPTVIELDGSAHVVKLVDKRETGKEVQAKHILIAFAGAERSEQTRTKDEAKQIAEDIARTVSTDNFSSVATQRSDDAGSGANGGDLGWFGKNMMVAAFEEAAFGLADGQISGVVESPFGYHIILKQAERPTYEYNLAHVMFDLKTAEEVLPPQDEWMNTQLSGKNLKTAALQFDQQTGEPHVSIEFNEDGKTLFAEITKRNVGKPVAIFLDGEPLSIPTVQDEITEGSAIITGSFSINEAKLLARRLNAGALPVPITLESQTSVGASLGQESLDSSLRAGIIGFIVVALFMLFYYRLPGLIAVIALLLYTAVNLAIFKVTKVTLTLSGIAGFILSVGMAVDANVLIFERLKEELLRGRTLKSAIDEGFRRAWLSIRDSNFTTLLTCFILYFTSSSLIKGFALTLALGVLISMFSAITVSRTLLRLVSGWKVFNKSFVYLPGLNKMPAGEKIQE